MTGGPTSASTGSPLGRRSFNPGTPRFVRFIALFAGTGPSDHASFVSRSAPLKLARSFACLRHLKWTVVAQPLAFPSVPHPSV